MRIAPLPCPFAFEQFQSIAGRYPQAVNLGGRIDLLQLPTRNVLDFLGQSLDLMALEDRGGALAGECLDHGL